MRRLLDDIDDFLSRYPEVSPGALGAAAVGDKYLYSGMTQRARRPREDTCLAARQWMADYIRASARRKARRPGARERLEDLAALYAAREDTPPDEVILSQTRRVRKPRARASALGE